MSRCVLKDFLKCKHNDCLKTDPLQIEVCPSWYEGRALNDSWAERENSRRSLSQWFTFEEKIKWAPFSSCSLCRHRKSTNFKCLSPILLSDEDRGSYSFCGKPTESSCPPRARLCYCAWQSSCQDKKSSQHTIFFCTTKPWIKSPVDDIRSRNKKLTSKCNSTESLGCSLQSLSWAGMVEAALWL